MLETVEAARVKLDNILLINDEDMGDGFKTFVTPLASRYKTRAYKLEIDYYKGKDEDSSSKLYWQGPGMKDPVLVPKSALDHGRIALFLVQNKKNQAWK